MSAGSFFSGARVSRRIALVVLLLAIARAVHAQDLGSDAFGYRATPSPTAFEDIRTVGQALPLASHPSSIGVAIGFPFSFYGAPQTSVRVVSEGYLTFGNFVTTTNAAIPSTSSPNQVIAPFWTDVDLTKRPTARVYLKLLGSAPTRRLVIQWSDVPLAADAGASLTFEAVLFEGTNAIEFRYGSMTESDPTSGRASGASATIGIENADGTDGIQIGFNRSGAVASGTGIRFDAGAPSTPALSVRSVLAGAGTAVDASLDVSRAIRSLRGVQGTLEVIPDADGLPPIQVRALNSATPGGPSFVTGLDLAASGPISFLLPVRLPDQGAAVPTLRGPTELGSMTLVIPADAVPGSSYSLVLTSALLAGEGGTAISATTIAGKLTIAGSHGAQELERLDVSVAPIVTTSESTPLTVIASGAGAALPNVAVTIFIGNPSAIQAAAVSGMTGPDGRFTTQVTGLAPGVSVVVASAPGVNDAETTVMDLDPARSQITSSPPLTATVGLQYLYAAQASPAGGSFALDKAPAGMFVDAATGLVTWTPTPDQVGPQDVVLRLTNTQTSQAFTVTVSAALAATTPNRPPKIVSTPPATALAVGQTFSYPLAAVDPDGDPLAFSLAQAPAGLTIDPTSGHVLWTPQPSDVGQSRALVLVGDGRGGLDGQGLIFNVAPPTSDQPPVITSQPVTASTIGNPYSYQVVATDPESKPLQYSLKSAPAGMTIDPNTGLINWDPTAAYYNPAPAPLHITGDTFVTADGSSAKVIDDHFQDPTNLVYGSLLPESAPGVGLTGWTPDPTTYGYSVGFGPAGPGGYLQGYGDRRDYLWVQNRAPGMFTPTPRGPVMGGDPHFGLKYDLHGRANKVVIFPVIDHGPLPGEALENSVYLSDDLVNWTLAKLETVYTLGWDSDPTHVANGMTGVYSLPSGQTFRYASVVWGGPASILQDGDNEIDAVAGLSEQGLSVGSQGTPTTVSIEVRDPAGNVTVQTYNLFVQGTSSFELKPSTLDFGAVAVGATAKQTVLVSNTGEVPLTVESVDAMGPYSAALRLVGGQVLVDVTFAPVATGTVTSTVTVVTDAGLATVTVTGLGADAAAVAPRPVFLSDAPVQAVVGKEYVYLPRVQDPRGQGLSFTLAGAPANASVNARSGLVRWTPAPAQTGVSSFSLTATDVAGNSATQSFSVVSVALSLDVSTTPLACPPGTNDFHVTIRLTVTPSRAIRSPLGVQQRVLLENVMPVDATVQLVADSIAPNVAAVQTTSEGEVFGWYCPLESSTISFDVKATDLAPEVSRTLTLSTRARVLPEEVGSLERPFRRLRTIDTLPFGCRNPRGLLADADTNIVTVLDRDTETLFRVDPSGRPLGSDSISNDAIDPQAVDLDHGLYAVVDRAALRLKQFTPGAGSPAVRSTKLPPSLMDPCGVAFDAAEGRRYVLDRATSSVFGLDPFFADHFSVAAQMNNPRAVTRDPTTGRLWVLDHDGVSIYAYDAAGNYLGRSIYVGQDVRSAEGVYFDAATQSLYVADGSPKTLYQYDASSGALLATTHFDANLSSPTGVTRDPVTRDFLVSDGGANRVVRLGGQFGQHTSLRAQMNNPRSIGRDPGTGQLWVLDRDGACVYAYDSLGRYTGNFIYVGSEVRFAEGVYFDAQTRLLMHHITKPANSFSPSGFGRLNAVKGADFVVAAAEHGAGGGDGGERQAKSAEPKEEDDKAGGRRAADYELGVRNCEARR